MIHPHLKLIAEKPREDYASVQFAVLLVPDVDIRSDAQLYTAVEENGEAVILPFAGVGWHPLPIVTLAPEEFQETWKGD